MDYFKIHDQGTIPCDLKASDSTIKGCHPIEVEGFYAVKMDETVCSIACMLICLPAKSCTTIMLYRQHNGNRIKTK
jgi:hypothetical protein